MDQTPDILSTSRLLESKPPICACICTHNGQATLRDCLDSLAGQTLEPDRFSILVVDDGSTDQTANLVRQWRDNHPDITCRLVIRTSNGLSAARNTGLQLSDAPLVAFLDDDALAGPGWLQEFLTAFCEFPLAAAVGGPVQVRWMAEKPRWWRDELDEVFNHFEPSDQPCTLAWPDLPIGCNFAVRRSIAVGLGRFRTDLGRQKGHLLGMEEIELFLRMLATDYQIAFWPHARIQHLALPHRVTRKYVLGRAWMHGRSLARLAYAYPQIGRTIPGAVRSLFQMLQLAPRYHFRVTHWKYWFFRLGYHWERLTMPHATPAPRTGRVVTFARRAPSHV